MEPSDASARVALGSADDGRPDLARIVKVLGEMEITSLLIEGGVDVIHPDFSALEPYAGDEGAVDASISYYTTHRARMDYPSYRARGLQIGSGTIESTCKHLVSARLKQAGMSSG